MTHKKSLKEKFRSHICKTDYCWLWTGRQRHDGYGIIAEDLSHVKPRRRAQLRAHRVSYELHYGPISTGLCVLHICDNRQCVNPDHLFLGSRRDNNIDKTRKGRGCCGEKHGRAKLRNSDVISIRSLHKELPQMTQRQLAQLFGTSQSNISVILRKRIWRNL